MVKRLEQLCWMRIRSVGSPTHAGAVFKEMYFSKLHWHLSWSKNSQGLNVALFAKHHLACMSEATNTKKEDRHKNDRSRKNPKSIALNSKVKGPSSGESYSLFTRKNATVSASGPRGMKTSLYFLDLRVCTHTSRGKSILRLR